MYPFSDRGQGSACKVLNRVHDTEKIWAYVPGKKVLTMKFTATNNHSFELTVPGHILTAEQGTALCGAILSNVAMEEPDKRRSLLSTVVSAVNADFKAQACAHVMLSDDVLKSLLSGVTFGKLSISKDGDSLTVNYGVAQKSVPNGKVDKTTVYVNRPDYIQYADVVRYHRAYNAKLKKEGYADGYTMNGTISAQQFNLLTVFAHNLARRLSNHDRTILDRMGDNFSNFAGESNTKRLSAVQFFYDLFNAKTGNDYKALGYVVHSLTADKRLSTFDSVHYVDTVPGEYTLLSVLISHYINTGVEILNKSKAKKLSGVTKDAPAPTAQEAPTADGPTVAVVIEPPCISDNRAIEYTAEAMKAYKAHMDNGTALPGNMKVDTAEDGTVIITYNR